LAYNFNNDIARDAANDRESPAAVSPSNMSPGPTPVPVSAPVATEAPQSAAFVRFRSCRWMQPKEEGHDTEFCTHREVKPYAGMTGFDADAWCQECQYYKLRRAPKKRSPDDYTY
jgi:hypothetical protein